MQQFGSLIKMRLPLTASIITDEEIQMSSALLSTNCWCSRIFFSPTRMKRKRNKNNRGQINYWITTFNTSINNLPAKLIASLLTCTSLMAPTNDGTGAALPFVLLSKLNPTGTPPTYQLSYNCIPFNFPLTSPFSCAPLPIWSVPKGGSAVVT